MVTRPWALFFLIIAGFSVLFPWYQRLREHARWTLFYVPALMTCLAVPLAMMDGWPRTLIAVALVAGAVYLLARSARRGWTVSG